MDLRRAQNLFDIDFSGDDVPFWIQNRCLSRVLGLTRQAVRVPRTVNSPVQWPQTLGTSYKTLGSGVGSLERYVWSLHTVLLGSVFGLKWLESGSIFRVGPLLKRSWVQESALPGSGGGSRAAEPGLRLSSGARALVSRLEAREAPEPHETVVGQQMRPNQQMWGPFEVDLS